MPGALTDEQVASYRDDGYVIARGLLDADETALLIEAARGNRALEQHAFGRKDGEGRESRLTLWNHPGEDIFGMVSRNTRIVDAMEALLGGEVYHYHSKLMLKEPRVGGAWEWHQDYGYWYGNGCLYPLMASCLIALDRASRENGCLQVLRGSQAIGRIEHGKFGEQAGADPERVSAAMRRHELVYCEMEPGDAIFFDGNTLHASAANESEHPRWSLICCYNAARNDPYKDSHHPRYTPLHKVPVNAIKEFGGTRVDPGNQSYLDPEREHREAVKKRF